MLAARWIAAVLFCVCVSLAPSARAQDADPTPHPNPDATPHPNPDATPHPNPDATPEQMVPPRLVHSEPPTYPENRIRERLHPSVIVQAVLDEHGHVVETRVEHSAGDDFDREAAAAVRRWVFEPARRGDRAIPSRIRVAVHFELPGFDLGAGAPITDLPTIPHAGSEDHEHGVGGHSGDDEPALREADPPAEAPEELAVETTVTRDEARAEDRAASDFVVGRETLDIAPTRDAIDTLNRAPGVYVARMGGDAVAPRIFLRGFDAEHGQDLELRVGGLRVNQASHIHGQGYADLGFLIGEVVDEMRVSEGVYDPQQGDFALAGTIDLRLGMRQRGWRIGASYGSFNSVRALAAWAPQGASRETFGAVQYRRTDGFGQNREGESGSAIVQLGLDLGSGWRMRALAIGYGARSQTAGLVREDDVAAGRVGFHDVYPFASARAQAASAGRVMLGLSAEYSSEDGESAEIGVFGGYERFRFLANFTGFHDDPVRGDLLEQTNDTGGMGLHARYRTQDYRPWEWARAALELGLVGRLDLIEQQQSSVDARLMNRATERQIDAGVQVGDIGLYGDLDLGLSEHVSVRLGVRGDLLQFEIDDRIVDEDPPTPGVLPGARRSAIGLAFGPRASVEVRPIEELSLRAAYGEGFRSPQARTLEEGDVPYTKVRSADLGARLRWERYLTLTLAGYFAHIDSDVVFEPHEGLVEEVGASRRTGFVFHAETRPVDWLRGALSLTYVNAELLETPGQSLPYVPPVVLRADVGANGTLVEELLGQRLTGRIGVGFSYLSPRPQPVGPDAPDVALLDASAHLGIGPLEVGVEMHNLTDARYGAVVQAFESNWSPGSPPSPDPVRHIAAGAPLTVLGTVRVSM